MNHANSLPRRTALSAIAASALGVSFSSHAQADTTIKLIVTFPPGGSTDIAARMIQPRLAEKTGRAVVVENRPGAASQVATQFVAKSPPDGNTLLVSFDSHAINPIAKPKLPYDTFKDFAGITLAVRFPLVIAASTSVEANDLRGFVELARKSPGKYSYASTGVGSMNQLVMEDIKRRAGIFVLHVPFGGGGPAVQAVLGDVASMTLLSYAALRSQIAAGKVKPLAVTGPKRLLELPHVPTVAESGFPGFEAHSWIGIFAPAATPPATLKRLTDDFQATLNSPDIHSKLTQAGFEVMATDGAGVDKHLRTEYERWNTFVQANKLKLED
ncbi:MAG: tripartite tricarboxylate transporter substrate binding protein [Burkholderiaceae bacterium]|jgi:tripartite-type tricarboxylate transporter receptor subunit TctC|nr:tripartite tricarboxylate transporter substrate binding protein [Burkholderiaceae bacterium]